MCALVEVEILSTIQLSPLAPRVDDDNWNVWTGDLLSGLMIMMAARVELLGILCLDGRESEGEREN